MKISDNTAVSMPMKNLISILAAVGLGVWAYFGVIERLNQLETDNTLIKKDLDQAVEFSIKWPRGELGSLKEIKESRYNAVNIDRLQKDVDKILTSIEILKDKVRSNGNGND